MTLSESRRRRARRQKLEILKDFIFSLSLVSVGAFTLSMFGGAWWLFVNILFF